MDDRVIVGAGSIHDANAQSASLVCHVDSVLDWAAAMKSAMGAGYHNGYRESPNTPWLETKYPSQSPHNSANKYPPAPEMTNASEDIAFCNNYSDIIFHISMQAPP